MRMRGHAEHDDMKYVPREMLAEWVPKDPILRYEAVPASTPRLAAQSDLDAVAAMIDQQLDRRPGVRRGQPVPRSGERPRPRLRRRHGPASGPTPRRRMGEPEPGLMAVLTYLDAIRLAMLEEMQRDPRVFVLGEDVGAYGGAFRVTAGFLETFGEGRVIDTPISESAIVGAAIGAALMGMRPIAEMQFIDFISLRLRPARELRGQEPLPLGSRRADRRAGPVRRRAFTGARTTARTPRPTS